MCLVSALGYEEIMLLSVALLDNRYFLRPTDKRPGRSEEQQKLVASDCTVYGFLMASAHNTVSGGIVALAGMWAHCLAQSYGVQPNVYGSRPFLSDALPVYDRES
jgi:hypothetical protein